MFDAKEDIIRSIENGEKRSAVAYELKMPQSRLSTLLWNKNCVKKNAVEKVHSASRHVRLTEYDDVEKPVYKWFLDVRGGNISISDQMLQKKACDFTCILSVPNFIMSSGCDTTLWGRQCAMKVKPPTQKTPTSELPNNGLGLQQGTCQKTLMMLMRLHSGKCCPMLLSYAERSGMNKKCHSSAKQG